METTIKKVKLSKIEYNEFIYPRIKGHNPSKVQEYELNLTSIEESKKFITVDANYRLLDGRHRHLAYLKNADGKDIDVMVYVREDVVSDMDAKIAGIEYNNSHGQQLSQLDKRKNAVDLYLAGKSEDDICKILAISKKTLGRSVKDIKDSEKAERKEKIMDMYMSCYTQQEIADAVGLSKSVVIEQTKEWSEMDNCPKPTKLSAEYNDGFEPPLYNIWTFGKKTNEVSHFGNSEVRIVDNLLYLYTNPFGIVVDPFGGGGSTIDICKKRLRRYFVSDRKPIIEREKDIRKLDITESLPEFNNRWSEVELVYLDPPYWKQAENQYSKDKEDLANQSIEDFNENLSSVINGFAKKMKKGSHIALIIQPTQWKSENKKFTDHVFDMCTMAEGVSIKTRIQAPYSTQQCTPQQVIWAKENKELLVLSREVIVFEVL